jgi:hypothetical protein
MVVRSGETGTVVLIVGGEAVFWRRFDSLITVSGPRASG